MSGTFFANRVCVITGGASGLGLELAKQLGASGARLILADIDDNKLNVASEALREVGLPVAVVQTDMTNSQAVRHLIDDAVNRFGRIDYLFNNAGVAVPGEIRDLDLEHWRHVIDVNLMGEIHAIHYAYPVMIRQGSGHIVNIASGFGMAPGPLNSPYVAAKFAVFGLSHALAAEARDFGIHVSVVCPGYLDTEMMAGLTPVRADAAAMRAQIPVSLMPVAKAAEIILSGVAKRKAVIAFPGYVRLLAFLHRFVPKLFSEFSEQQVRQFRSIRRT